MQKNLLRGQITAKGYTIGSFCAKIGLSEMSFRSKCNEKTEFTVRELKTIKEVLSLTSAERDRIFFDE